MAAGSASMSATTVMDAAPLAIIPPPTAVSVQKRYESLMAVRTKALNGKGAWYWAHLEPFLVHSIEDGEAKAVKLRCTLCNAVFSASNPSRTGTEHLKRGSCPNFSSPSASVPRAQNPSAKRSDFHAPHHFTPSPTTPSSRAFGDAAQWQTSTSEDPGAVTMTAHNAKKLKSPLVSPVILSEAQVKSAVSLLSDWLYDSIGTGAVSLSSLDHPKFQSFMNQVGLPPFSGRKLLGQQLDLRYQKARGEADARIRDAMFFQLSSNGWNAKDVMSATGETIVKFTVNLPNGVTVFQQAVMVHQQAPSAYAEVLMLNSVKDLCGSNVQRCSGIIADRFKTKALRELEERNHWMVNICCLLQGFRGLVKDFSLELPLFQNVASNCYNLASYFNNKSQVRNIFRKYQLREHGNASLLRVSPLRHSISSSSSRKLTSYTLVLAMLEDVLNYSRAIQLVVVDETYKLVCFDDPKARELAEMIRDMGFWNNLDAAHSLVSLINGMIQEMQAERPLLGQCLPLWDELRSKVRECCSKFGIDEEPVKNMIERRFKKNYHPAWSAAFILDPLYLMQDSTGKYLPPFKYLNSEQEKDVDRLITRLVSSEEAHIALMELMRWRTEGLDPLYAKAVQLKQLDPSTGKMRSANPQSSRLVWETCLSEFKCLAKVAVRLIFMRATSSSFKSSLALLSWMSARGRSKASTDRARKLVFVAENSKMERRDFSSEEEKDVEIFGELEDDVLHHSAFVETPSV